MKQIAIAGGWRKINAQVEKDIRKVVREIISEGNGIVSGGALPIKLRGSDNLYYPKNWDTQMEKYYKNLEQLL